MNRTIYNYDYNRNYILNKKNIFAYSFFATKILKKKEEFIIDLDSIISHISDSIVDKDEELNVLRRENHDKYYSIDIKFLREIGDRYKDKVKKAIYNYDHIKSNELLTEDEDIALAHKKQLDVIDKIVSKFKEKVKDDLLIIIDYVDNDEKQLDLTFLKDENLTANKLKSKYNALLLKKSVINMDNLNLELQRQKERLVGIRQLIPETKRYVEKRTYYLSEKYSENDVQQLKENLSIILSEYIFLLTHQEFSEVKKIYQGILKQDFSYVDDFLYAYRIMLDKIWKHQLTNIAAQPFDFYYLICEEKKKCFNISLMNRKNMNHYSDIGYICHIDGSMFELIDIEPEELLLVKFPHQIQDKLTFRINKTEEVVLDALYNKSNSEITNSEYPVVNIK